MSFAGRMPEVTGVFLAEELERALYIQFPFNDQLGAESKQLKKDYRTRYLMLKGNLPKNLPLVTELLAGERLMETLCTMSAQELANPEVQVSCSIVLGGHLGRL